MDKQLDVLLSTFRRIGGIWDKELPCCFWGDETLSVQLMIDHHSNIPTAWQRDALAAILDHPNDLRPYCERELFTYYKDKIYGYAQYTEPGEKGDYGRDEITPPIQQSAEIWSLVSDPFVIIESQSQVTAAVEFMLDFDCHWDEEHGVAVWFRNWQIIQLGTA